MTMTKTRIQVAFQAYSEVGQILEGIDPKGDKPPRPVPIWLAGLGPTFRPSMRAALRLALPRSVRTGPYAAEHGTCKSQQGRYIVPCRHVRVMYRAAF